MPLPTLVAPASAGCVGRHMFLSYSHLDAELAEPFMRTLCALAGNAPELGLAAERIFFDRAKLRAGDDWNDSIQSHLERADLFLLLVSSQSLTSRYCLTAELAGAARRGIPIVPVLLSATPSWDTRPVDGDPQGRALGAFNGVPINGKWGPQFIRGGNWATRDAALTQAVQQIAARLARDDAPLQAAAAARTPRRALAPLLPNLCNQQQPASSFENGLDGWPAEQALLVLVKGEFADDTPGFWERLCHKNLADFCEAERAGVPLRPVRPLQLPSAYVDGKLIDDIPLAVRRALSEALFGSSRRLRSGADLAALLASDGGLLPLCATLPDEPAAGVSAVLAALLALVDDTPAGTPLGRLVIAVLVEAPALVAEERLADALALHPRAGRCHLVETRRLLPLSGDDVKRWHRQHRLADVLRLDEEQLVQRLFKGAASLRHRPFDQQVRPLLGLTCKDAAR